MAQTWDNLLAFLRDHGDVLTAAMALIVLAEASVIFLWARSAGDLRARAADSLRSAERAQLEVARLQGEVSRLEEASRQGAARAGVYRVRSGEGEAAPATAALNGEAAATPAAASPPPPLRALPAEPPPPAAEPTVPAPAPTASDGDPARRELVFPEEEVAPSPTTLRAASWATSLESATASLTGGAAGDAGGSPSLSWAELLGDPGTTTPAEQAPAVPTPVAEPSSSTPAGWGQLPAPVAPTPPPAEWSPAPAEVPAALAPEADTPPDGSAADDVLLVEDDDNVARLYRTLLEGRGFSLRHAEDGVVGLEEVHRRRPGLILLDMMMPRMNGITFLQSMREDPSLADVPVVVLSNFREERLVERAAALGALEYLVKAQTRPAALVDAIPHWMRGVRVG